MSLAHRARSFQGNQFMARAKSWHSIPEYNALRALMQAGTASGAARQLGLSQSAVSRSIASLEDRLGTSLFERVSGRLRPTQEAVLLNRRLDPLFEALERIDGPEEPIKETLRLIAPPTYAHGFLVGLIESFLKMNPGFLVSFEVNTSEEVSRGVLEERFDLGITGIEMSRAGVKLIPYRRSQAVCVMPRDHRLAERDKIQPQDLHGEDMVALTYRHARRGQFDRVFQTARSVPRIRAEVSTTFAAAELTRAGLGISVLNPFPLYHYCADSLAFVSFDSPLRYRSYFLVPDNRPVPRVVRAFMRHVRLNTRPDPFSEKAS